MIEQWVKELDIPVTITDKDGNIIYMNNKSIKTFEDDGGEKLIGNNLAECHNTSSNIIIEAIKTHKIKNIYTIEKKGKKKLIFQAPYYINGEYSGVYEISIELPDEMPHFIRQ